MEKFGPYIVIETIRLSNPRWPQFTIMRAGHIVGISLSAVDRGWCEFVERMAQLGRYAEASPVKRYDYHLQKKRKA